MTAGQNFAIPDEMTMLETFGVEPVEARPGDTYWCYKFTDANHVTLKLSWNIIEKSLQITVSANDRTIAIISREGDLNLTPITYKDGLGLEGEFCDGGKNTTIRIRVQPDIKVGWYTLAND